MRIKEARAFKVLNSRAEETIAIRVKTKSGDFWSGAPSGASVSKYAVPIYTKNLKILSNSI